MGFFVKFADLKIRITYRSIFKNWVFLFHCVLEYPSNDLWKYKCRIVSDYKFSWFGFQGLHGDIYNRDDALIVCVVCLYISACDGEVYRWNIVASTSFDRYVCIHLNTDMFKYRAFVFRLCSFPLIGIILNMNLEKIDIEVLLEQLVLFHSAFCLVKHLLLNWDDTW